MLTAIGIGLIVAGAVVVLFGDKNVGNTRTPLLKLVEWPAGRAKWLKFAIGAALVYAGIMILFR